MDTDEYRKGRAVEVFNLGAQCANDLLEPKPTLMSWVPHILVFIVPRQMVFLGDPTRRSCDACESFGAMVKKTIMHQAHAVPPPPGGCRAGRAQEQVVGQDLEAVLPPRRAGLPSCHRCASRCSTGVDNAPYLQRTDARRKAVGKTNTYKKLKEDEPDSSTMRQLCEDLGSPTPTPPYGLP